MFSYFLVTKCEAGASALDSEIDLDGKKDEESGESAKRQKLGHSPVNDVKETGITLKPKQEFVAKSVSQMISEQRGNAALAARMAMARRAHPLVSLNPYQGSWTIKVRVANKRTMRNYRNARGEGCVFNVELTDEEWAEDKIRVTA